MDFSFFQNASKELSRVELLYMNPRPAPTDYHQAIQSAAKDYEHARQMLGFLYDVMDFESSIPADLTLEDKAEKYKWQLKGDYPPHLSIIPHDHEASKFFKFQRLVQTILVIFNRFHYWMKGLAPTTSLNTFEKLTKWNQERHNKTGWFENLYTAENIGLRDDWHTDAVFAQQFFTGPNPSTITLASDDWIAAFKGAATVQGNDAFLSLLSSSDDLFYVQDFSYIRASMGASPDEELYDRTGNINRYGCAPVALFRLTSKGKLHPIAIVIDYKGSMDASVTIFNKRLDVVPNDTAHLVKQTDDWPWRYAKMCVMSADWVVHEMIIHLTHTHFVEEAVIVAGHRTLNSRHIVFRLLSPHWAVTLSLNLLGRTALVPSVIAPIAGFSSSRICTFIRNEFSNFDWKGKYIPNDLQRRGFPIEQLDEKRFHNYAYARNILAMWNTLRRFVRSVLGDPSYYPDDQAVRDDAQIQAFCDEMRSPNGAGMVNFPESCQTVDELVDLVTMSIHIASPQHTAVNYLQQYYQTFVPNKPSSLFSPLPASLTDLKEFKEPQLISALPLGHDQQWLLMAQVPYLLSSQVSSEQSIVTYAEKASKGGDCIIKEAARQLSDDLQELAATFANHSRQLDDQTTAYDVLQPVVTASSILI